MIKIACLPLQKSYTTQVKLSTPKENIFIPDLKPIRTAAAATLLHDQCNKRSHAATETDGWFVTFGCGESNFRQAADEWQDNDAENKSVRSR